MIKALGNSKWNSRKVVFGAALIAVAVAVELLAPNGFTPTMAAFLGTIGATYFIGNVAEKKTEATEQPPASASAAPVDLSPLLDAVAESTRSAEDNSNSIKSALATLIESNTAIKLSRFYPKN